MRHLGRMFSAVLLGVSACAPSILSVTPSTVTRIDVPPPTQQLDSSTLTTIEVRYYAHSPTVTIVAWDATQTAYGLRAWLRRDGSLIRDHRLFVSTYYQPTRPVFTHAVTPSRPLELTGIARDPFWCVGGKPCTPPETFGALIPDTLLRSHPDSLPVTFYDRAGNRLFVTLHRDLIEAYLERVDSIVAVMRQRRS
jgi:hypothetical protein